MMQLTSCRQLRLAAVGSQRRVVLRAGPAQFAAAAAAEMVSQLSSLGAALGAAWGEEGWQQGHLCHAVGTAVWHGAAVKGWQLRTSIVALHLSLSCAVPLSASLACFWYRRYFLRKLRRVKKANGQILACNEVRRCGEGGHMGCQERLRH